MCWGSGAESNSTMRVCRQCCFGPHAASHRLDVVFAADLCRSFVAVLCWWCSLCLSPRVMMRLMNCLATETRSSRMRPTCCSQQPSPPWATRVPQPAALHCCISSCSRTSKRVMMTTRTAVMMATKQRQLQRGRSSAVSCSASLRSTTSWTARTTSRVYPAGSSTDRCGTAAAAVSCISLVVLAAGVDASDVYCCLPSCAELSGGSNFAAKRHNQHELLLLLLLLCVYVYIACVCTYVCICTCLPAPTGAC